MKKTVLLNITILVVLIFVFYSFVSSSCDDSNKKDADSFEYHEENLVTLSSITSSSTAKNILKALEETCAMKQNTKLETLDIIKLSDNTYEIYVGLMVRVYIENEHIKLYTFETKYNENDSILLYDTRQSICKILNSSERNDLIYTQRKYLVNNTIKITPYVGLLFHNMALNTTRIENLTFTNCSDTEISYINIIITPCISGIEYDYNNSSYTYFEKLGIGKSSSVDLQKTGWTNYDTYAITQVLIMFSDGTTIKFDSFDCHFLAGNDDNENADSSDSSQNNEPSTGVPSLDDNKNQENNSPGVELMYTLSDDKTYYIVSGYSDTSSNVVIPDMHDGLPIRKIGAWAFSDKSGDRKNKLVSITISKNIIEIEKHAFDSCKNLREVIFLEDSELTTIQNEAFKKCISLTNITIPKNVIYIGDDAFVSCDKLSNVYMTVTTGWRTEYLNLLSSDMADSSLVAQWLRGQNGYTIYTHLSRNDE